VDASDQGSEEDRIDACHRLGPWASAECAIRRRLRQKSVTHTTNDIRAFEKQTQSHSHTANLASSAGHYSNGWGASTANDLDVGLLNQARLAIVRGIHSSHHTRELPAPWVRPISFVHCNYHVASSSSLQLTNEHSIALLLYNADLHARLSRLGLTRPLHTAEDWWLV
jgi:hypothetical protein